MKLFDCNPTMTDREVLKWCRDGYVILPEVVPTEVNERVVDYAERRPGNLGADLLGADWYEKSVTLNPTLVGIVRSLLGRNFAYPRFAANHRTSGPQNGTPWHQDGGAVYGPAVDCLQVFYLPQAATFEMGPTLILPGSHFLFSRNQYMTHYGSIKGEVSTLAPQGTIFITHYAIWHRRPPSTSSNIRNLLKFWYIRTVSPAWDWVREPGFTLDDTFACTETGSLLGRDNRRARNDAAGMFHWLTGAYGDFERTVRHNNLPIYFAMGAEARETYSSTLNELSSEGGQPS